MHRTALFLSFAVVLASAATAPAQTASPYVGQQQRSIKALSDQEVRDLTEGRGMGLAKAAELNSYPGPMHVLELAGQLELSDTQRAATQSLRAIVRNKAPVLGARIIEAERDLDRAFAEGWIDAADLRSRTKAIAALQGELRAVHLEAHLAQRVLLTAQQIARYDELRGYRTAANPVEHRPRSHK